MFKHYYGVWPIERADSTIPQRCAASSGVLSDQSNPLISIACLLSYLWRTAVIFEELAQTFILLSIAGTGRPVNASLSFMDP
jgi:hypothetical protein